MNHFDLIILGAGPAGISAALTAAQHQLSVALFDENPAAGGQVYRAPAVTGNIPRQGEAVTGDNLRNQLAGSNVSLFMGHQVWSVTGDFRVDALGPDGPVCFTSRLLLVAAGTTERVVPFEGWTLPGVIGLAAATLLLKSQQTLPGKTTLVAGCGPLLAAVAGATLKAGGQVAAIADIAAKQDWARTVPAMLRRPDILKQSIGYGLPVLRARTPLYSRHTLVRATAQDGQLLAELAPCDATGNPLPGPRRELLVDCITVGHGLTPSTEVTRLLNARHHYSRQTGGFVATIDKDGQTSRPRLFAAGDCTGIYGAAAALRQGVVVALACVSQLKPESNALQAAGQQARNEWQRVSHFGQKMAGLMALREGHTDSIPPDTVVCRCEDVSRADIEAACDAGAAEVNQLKAWTRCGMGPCQGRSCGDVAAEIVARRRKTDREAAGIFSPRTPLRPLTVSDLTGDFDYADIPIPKAAPL